MAAVQNTSSGGRFLTARKKSDLQENTTSIHTFVPGIRKQRHTQQNGFFLFKSKDVTSYITKRTAKNVSHREREPTAAHSF